MYPPKKDVIFFGATAGRVFPKISEIFVSSELKNPRRNLKASAVRDIDLTSRNLQVKKQYKYKRDSNWRSNQFERYSIL